MKLKKSFLERVIQDHKVITPNFVYWVVPPSENFGRIFRLTTDQAARGVINGDYVISYFYSKSGKIILVIESPEDLV